MAQDENPGEKSSTGKRAVSICLAIIIAVSLAVLFYTVTYTASSDPIVLPYAAALALGLAIVMFLFGWIDVNRAAKGLLSSVISILPNIHNWGAKNIIRSSLVAGMFLSIAGLSIWLGPFGVVNQTIQCDEATEIKFSVRSTRVACNGAINRNIWLSPLDRLKPITLACFDENLNRWDGTYAPDVTSRCGDRPQDASYISNGISFPEIDTLTVSGQRMNTGLDRLRKALTNGSLPDRKVKDRLLFATWNLRDFGDPRPGFGAKLEESYAFIAEIISHFDLIAIQELKDRTALQRLLDLLGPDYKAEFSFIAPGRGGNGERLGFIYDTRKISFGEVSTTIVIEFPELEQSRTGQPARPPFLAEFVLNERKFFVVTAHALFGSTSGPKYERRLRELEAMAKSLNRTFGRNFPNHPVIFAGDMNVSSSDSREMEALLGNGFETDPILGALNTNINDTKPYDQILIWDKNNQKMPIGRYGVFNPFDHVFRLDDWEKYRIDMQKLMDEKQLKKGELRTVFDRYFRTYQISDHRVKWAEFRVDW